MIPDKIGRYIVSAIDAEFSERSVSPNKLKCISLPDTLMSIEDGAFCGFSALKEVIGGKNVIYVTRDAFEGTALAG